MRWNWGCFPKSGSSKEKNGQVANEKWPPGHYTVSLSRYKLGVSRDVVRWGGSLPDGVESSPPPR